MGFRDDHDAALHRVAALERELADTKAKLAEAEAKTDAAHADAEPAEAVGGYAPPDVPGALRDRPLQPVAGRPRTEHGVSIRAAGAVTTLSWFGWGTGNFLSVVLLFLLPPSALLLLGVWIAAGFPAATPWDLPMSVVVLGIVLAVWNTAALALNHRNRITVGASQLVVHQGLVPWPVAFRRTTIALADVRGFDVDSDWDPESELTVYRVYALRASDRVRITGATSSEARANLIADELARATKTHRA